MDNAAADWRFGVALGVAGAVLLGVILYYIKHPRKMDLGPLECLWCWKRPRAVARRRRNAASGAVDCCSWTRANRPHATHCEMCSSLLRREGGGGGGRGSGTAAAMDIVSGRGRTADAAREPLLGSDDTSLPERGAATTESCFFCPLCGVEQPVSLAVSVKSAKGSADSRCCAGCVEGQHRALMALQDAIERGVDVVGVATDGESVEVGAAGTSAAHVASEDALCVVCLDDDNERNTVLTPCGHLLCAGCAAAVSRCPTCRARVEGRVRAYM